ncbi:MAG: archease [Deltaproteobacteria bacterium]|nr:archease [Deltaproteobacteria bacterium]
MAELFAEAGRALAEVMGQPGAPSRMEPQRIAVQASDREALLVEWLNELVFRSERTGELFPDLTVDEITDRALRATIRGSEVRESRSQVKAATFHALRIEEGPTGLTATVVLDV